MFWNVIWPSAFALYAITMFFVNVRQGDSTMAGLWAASATVCLMLVGLGLRRVRRAAEKEKS